MDYTCSVNIKRESLGYLGPSIEGLESLDVLLVFRQRADGRITVAVSVC